MCTAPVLEVRANTLTALSLSVVTSNMARATTYKYQQACEKRRCEDAATRAVKWSGVTCCWQFDDDVSFCVDVFYLKFSVCNKPYAKFLWY